MLFSYIKTALRIITKNRLYSALNILGLAIGLIAFIFILIYVKVEANYDTYNKKHDRIHRLESSFVISGKSEEFAIVPIPMAPALKQEFPEIESFVRFSTGGNQLLRFGEKQYYEKEFYFADSTVFDVFSYTLLKGNPQTALVEPNSVVLTQSTANKYFQDENPIGKVLLDAENDQFKVTGVMKDLPHNTHLKFDGLFSATTLAARMGNDRFNNMEPGSFWNIGLYSYILLKENTSIDAIHDKFPSFYDKYMRAIGEQINASFSLLTTPLAKTHFSGHYASDRPKGNMTYLYIFSAVGLFILIIAAINYMNMATARSVKRAKEVGIRKVSGAHKGQLIKQFLSESVILTFISLIIAAVVVYLLFPNFQNLIGKELSLSVFFDLSLWIQVLGAALLIGLLAGSYPAFYLSSFNPAQVLKGTMSGKAGGSGRLRKALVVIQFWIAIMMIIGNLIISDQLSFLRSKDLGFQKENMIVMELQDSTFRSKGQSFKKELMNHPDIISATTSTGVPGQNGWIQVVRVEKESEMIDDAMIICVPDYDYLNTYEIEMAKGRFFEKEMGTHLQEAVVVNETAVKQYGWDDPIGKKIHWGFSTNGEGGRVLKVIGVFEDYHFKSLHNKVQPMMMFLYEDIQKGILTVKTSGENNQKVLSDIESRWHEFGAKRPFDYQFLDQSLSEMYEGEQKTGIIFHIATVITLMIALIGLLGLSSFIAEQKTKEIGVRKVLGASVSGILMLLYREFTILILAGFVLAIPLTWWGLDNWLQNNFVYAINMSWAAFAMAGIASILVGLLAISYHTIKAANGNMVEAVKWE